MDEAISEAEYMTKLEGARAEAEASLKAAEDAEVGGRGLGRGSRRPRSGGVAAGWARVSTPSVFGPPTEDDGKPDQRARSAPPQLPLPAPPGGLTPGQNGSLSHHPAQVAKAEAARQERLEREKAAAAAARQVRGQRDA